MSRWCALVALVLWSGCGAEPDETPSSPRGELIGRVEISEDVPTGDCRVLLEGTPLGAPCDPSGGFDIRGVPPGRWDLRVATGEATALPGKRLVAAANAGLVTDLGVVRLAKPGSVGGRVAGDSAGSIIALPAYGVVTAPNANGGYLLTGAPPGVHDLVMITRAGTVVRTPITIVSARTTTGVDFDAAMVTPVSAPIVGLAVRGDDVPGGDAGLTVELLDAATGAVVTSDRTAADGSFELTAGAGIYVVRARDGQTPATAILPSVVPQGSLALTLPVTLVVPVPGDLDRDGRPDASDPDIDNDGVPNAADKFPYDPAESADADSDGLGDRADLATMGTALDTQNPTPDTDGDTRFDFEDVCPKVADPMQRDSDGDRIGDLCDNCPNTPNPGQEDAVGDHIGDVCRLCSAPEDCPSDKICRFGRCVDCAANSQCGGEICDPQGACVPCTATAQCGGTRKCNTGLGLCQDCLVALDCASGQACVQGRCFSECTVDRDCGSGFCQGGACVLCRSNGDCPAMQWCDAGLCRPGCVTDASCGGVRVCDLPTRTCVLPCTATCPTGQSCDSGGICRQVCDLTFPCPGNQICTMGSCRPECTVNGDCTGGKVCQLGQCVASGLCNLDTDCPASQVCSGTGACVARTTAFDTAAGAYLCTQPCQCKLGEMCSAGHCVADGVPTRYVAAGGIGNGSSIAMATGTLTTALSSLAANDLVALRAGDSFDHNGPALVVNQTDIRLQGGYLECSPKRWVRDPALRATIRKTGDAELNLLRLPGTLLAPLRNLTLKGLTLTGYVPTDSELIDATFVPNLATDGLTLDLTGAGSNGAITGLRVTSSAGLQLSNIALPAHNTRSNLEVVRLEQSGGTVRGLSIGTVIDGWQVRGLVVVDPITPVNIDDTTTGTWTTGSSSSAIVIRNANRAPVRITGGRAQWTTGFVGTNDSSAAWAVVLVDTSRDVNVTGLVVDGTGFLDPFASWTRLNASAVHYISSTGVIDGVSVTVPLTPGYYYLRPFWITGPVGDVTLSNATVRGDGCDRNTPVFIEDVSSGVATITGGSFALTQTPASASTNTGLQIDDSRFLVTGASFHMPGQAQYSHGFLITNGIGRIERSRFQADADGAITGVARGGVFSGGTVELHQSWLQAGPAFTSAGLELRFAAQLRAVGNTLDGEGLAGRAGSTSAGVMCNQETAPLLFQNNLVRTGSAPTRYMVWDYGFNGGPCILPAAWDHNYFSLGALPRDANDDAMTVALGAPGVPDARGNIIGDTVTCADSAFAAPDFHIAAGSPCVNTGVLSTRSDGSSITMDLLGGARVLGSATDIGCHEKQ